MGARKSTLQIFEMPGCARISGSLHMTIHTAVLIETLKYLISDLCWCSCKILSNQYHTVAFIVHDESYAAFSWNGEILKEYFYCILNALI